MIRTLSILATVGILSAQPRYFANIQTYQVRPITGSTYTLGTTGARWSTVFSDNAVLTAGFRLGTSATAGHVLTTDALGNGSWQSSGGLPVVDTTYMVKGSVDATKQMRFEVDGLNPSTPITLTPQALDYTIAGINISQIFTGVNTHSSNIVMNASILPGTAGFQNVGDTTYPFSTMVATTFYTRLAGLSCNYNSSTATALAGGTFAVQDSSCNTQARMNSTGFDTVGVSGGYKIQGTEVITASRNLRNIASISTSLIPTVTNTYDLGSNTGTGYFAFGYITNLTVDVFSPKTSGSDVGAAGAGNGFDAIYGDNLYGRTSLTVTGTSTLYAATPATSYTYNLGGSSNYWNLYYGRVLNLQSQNSASSPATINIRNDAAGLLFLMGDTGTGAGDFRVYDSGVAKFEVYSGVTNLSTTAINLTGNVTASGGTFSATVGSGNFYLRTFTGAPSCASVADGWIGVDTTGGTVGRLYICNGGNARYVDLN